VQESVFKFAYIWITYYLVSIAESYLVANIAIPENYEKLIVSLRTTQSKEYSLDKEQTSFSDSLDALRLSLKGYTIN
jgi:hypothetical protein